MNQTKRDVVYLSREPCRYKGQINSGEEAKPLSLEFLGEQT